MYIYTCIYILFILLTADLPSHVNNEKSTCFTYADDTTAVVSGDSWEDVFQEVTNTNARLAKYSCSVD